MIDGDQREPDSGNYVALMGYTHLGDAGVRDISAARGTRYPGVDRLTGGISVNTSYIHKGEGAGIHPGKWHGPEITSSADEALTHNLYYSSRSDFDLKLPTPT
jgi:hypothetical protein